MVSTRWTPTNVLIRSLLGCESAWSGRSVVPVASAMKVVHMVVDVLVQFAGERLAVRRPGASLRSRGLVHRCAKPCVSTSPLHFGAVLAGLRSVVYQIMAARGTRDRECECAVLKVGAQFSGLERVAEKRTGNQAISDNFAVCPASCHRHTGSWPAHSGNVAHRVKSVMVGWRPGRREAVSAGRVHRGESSENCNFRGSAAVCTLDAYHARLEWHADRHAQ